MSHDTLTVNNDSIVKTISDSALLPKTVNTQILASKSNILIDKVTEKGLDPQYIAYINSYKSEPWNEIVNVKNYTFYSLLSKNKIYNYNDSYSDKSFKNKLSKKELKDFNQFVFTFNDLTLFLIIFAFVLIAFVKALFNKYLTQLFRAIISYSEAYKLYRDYNAIIDRVYFLLNLNFVISGGLFGYFLIKCFRPGMLINYNILILLLCSVFILSVYFTRYLLNKFIGYILDQNHAFDEFLHSNFLYYKAAGLFLIPIVSFLTIISDQYHFALVLTGIFIIFIMYLISIFRATAIMLKKGILLFYWILYLCIIEFLPILLLYKFFNAVV